ncbi:hypothetical protein CON36_31455 [Bacillus cereus]|uniref:Uncharacterized protein n=1 Tax=Bacillus cereus TaxID=1396 RepID=A0A9X6STQ2_BACCE|nr:hypothetical protein [Bacillus cereus]PDZ94884.1 hypothetical protein CON36_31455 [Bacillus cereus]
MQAPHEFYHGALKIVLKKSNQYPLLKGNILTVFGDYNNQIDFYFDETFIMLERDYRSGEFCKLQKYFFVLENNTWQRRNINHKSVILNLHRIKPHIYDKSRDKHTLKLTFPNDEEGKSCLEYFKNDLSQKFNLVEMHHFRRRSWNNDLDLLFRSLGIGNEILLDLPIKNAEQFNSLISCSALSGWEDILMEQRVKALFQSTNAHFLVNGNKLERVS